MYAVRSVAFAAVMLAIVGVGASAQTTEECTTWLSYSSSSSSSTPLALSSGAFAFEPFMNCLNRTTTAPDATLINEVVNMVRAGADMHSFGTYVPGTRAAVQAINPNTPSRNYERTLLEIERALGTAGDLHLTLSGTPYLDSYFVIRLFRPSVRLSANGQRQELFIHTVLTQTTIDSYRQNMQGQNGGTYAVPSHATFAATLNKTIRTVNGMDAMEWARNEVRYLGFFTPSMRMNLGVLGLFNMRMSQVFDLVSAREAIVFEDGTTLSYPRIVIKGSEGGSPRCDIGVPRNDANVDTPAASSSRRQAALELPAGFVAAPDDENMNLELRDDSVPALKRIGDATKAIGTAVKSSVEGTSGAIDAAAPTNDLLFSREFTGLGKFQIRSRVQGNVAVLTVNSFLPPAPTGGSFGISDIALIYQNISVLFNESAKRNVKELMIDMSANTGGYVALQNLYLRVIDAAYNIYWDRPTMMNPHPTLINVTDQNVMWSRTYLRRSIQSTPIGEFFVNLLNRSTVYLNNTPVVPGEPVWFDPVGRTRDGWTDPFIRPALFNVPAVAGLFTSIKIVTDGICGSSCCLFMERVKEFGFAGASVEFVGFGGDMTDSGFQMGDACGGSVNKMCTATIVAKLQPNHPFLTGTSSNHAVDVSFVDSAYFKRKAATTPAQYDMRAFASRVYRDWNAVGASDEAHELRFAYLYGGLTGGVETSPSSSRQVAVVLAMLMAVMATVAGF